jgi:hypothetical protein
MEGVKVLCPKLLILCGGTGNKELTKFVNYVYKQVP